MDKRIPVTLLTGFLGSGKTTLLNKLLRHEGMKNTAVIINEIGKAGLDHILSRHVDDTYIADNTVLLGSGCLCCTLREELADTMRDLFFRRELEVIPKFTRLVIETTGLADPGPILANLLNQPIIGPNFRLDAVVVTVDAEYGLRQIEQHAEANKQAAIADVLLLTKVDLVSQTQLDSLADALQALNSGATQHRISQGEIDPQAIINVGLFDPHTQQAQPQRWLRATSRAHSTRGTLPQKVHDDAIVNFTITLPTALTWTQIEPALKWLCATFGERLLRMKGILYVEGYPAPLVVHAVQHTLYPAASLVGWSEDQPSSRLVLIGKGLDEKQIRDRLMKI